MPPACALAHTCDARNVEQIHEFALHFGTQARRITLRGIKSFNMSKNNTYKHTQFEVKITTQSPVHIGTGETLSSTGEYFAEGISHIHILDNDKLMRYLQDEDKLNEYIDKITEQGEKFKYVDTLRDLLKCTKDTEVYNFLKSGITRENGEKISFSQRELGLKVGENFGVNDNNILRLHVRTRGGAYLPGSSLKGAVRTAIVMQQLVNANKKYQKEMPDKPPPPKKEKQTSTDDITQIGALFGMATQPNDKGETTDMLTNLMREVDNFIDKYKNNPQGKNKIKDLEALRNIWQPIEEKLATAKYNSKKNEYGEKYQLPDYLRFTDSNTIKDEFVKVYQTVRELFYTAYDKDGKPHTQAGGELDWLVECIAPEAVLSNTMTLYLPPNEARPKILKGNQQGKTLHRLINKHTSRLIEVEIQQLERKTPTMINTDLRNTLVKQLKAYKTEIKNNDQYAILRLGMGKPVFFQTIAALISDLNKREQFLNILRNERHLEGSTQSIIPRTRSLAAEANERLMFGWVKIQITKNT